MKKFNDMTAEEKVHFFLGIAERSLRYITGENLLQAKNALSSCRKQLSEGVFNGEFLYLLLDNEDNGITVLAEMCEDEKECAALECVTDAVAYMSRYAYEKQGAQYFPEPIELVDHGLVTHLICCYKKCSSEKHIAEEIL